MEIKKTELQQAFDNCSRDPIHIPGRIQQYGILLAADSKFDQFEFVSENVLDVFQRNARDLVGMETTELFSARELHAIRNSLSQDTIEFQRELLAAKTINGDEYQVSVHRKGQRAILELLPEQSPAEKRFRMLERAKAFLTTPLSFENIELFFSEATERLRSINGYDRVKFYRFLPDGSGEVIAEARHPKMDSFLGLRFPSTDIPPIARRLYAQTPIRALSDVAADDVQVLGREGSEPLDMSLAVLRGKEPIHNQYLQNMGILCTETVPVVLNGELWGLFASHHNERKIPDPSALGASELAGKLISLRVQHALEAQKQSNMQRCMKISNRLVVVDDSKLATSDYWAEVREEFFSLIPADGVIFSVDGTIDVYGDVPGMPACHAACALADPEDDGVSAIDNLADRLPGANWGDTGGALIISPAKNSTVRIVFLRNLTESTIKWAGSPEKEVVVDESGPKLNPRNSFNMYMENVRGRCDAWTANDIEIASALQTAMAHALSEQSELRENRHRLGLMVRELNHRVRNILSLVQSLSRHSREEARSVKAYAEVLEKRILALAGAHNLLTRSEMRGALLADMLKLEFRPFDASANRTFATGPDVALRPDASSVLALLFHELTTNAAKYGALSVSSGQVHVSWGLENDGVALHWKESGGPDVLQPLKTGFGRSIIEDAIPFEFKGKATLKFLEEGVEAQFWLPGDVITELAERVPSIQSPPAKPETSQDQHLELKSGGHALVVEDNFVVAMLSKRLLLENGFADVSVAATIGEAMTYLSKNSFQFCLLDVNLQGELSTPIARYLEKNSIPFIFATGYGSDGHDIVEDHSAPMISKPIDGDMLQHALKSVGLLN